MLDVQERTEEAALPRQQTPQAGAGVWVLVGRLFYVFAVVDLGLFYFAETDITGVWWSPLAAVVLGSLLIRGGRRQVTGGDE